jgi:PAS domain S-box-containing protein
MVDLSERSEKTDELFQLAVESARAPVIVNHIGLIVHVNQEIEGLFSYRREARPGQSIEILVPEAIRKRHTGYPNDFLVNHDPVRWKPAGNPTAGGGTVRCSPWKLT